MNFEKKISKRSIVLWFCLICVAVSGGFSTRVVNGAEEINIGMSTSLTGPSALLGKEMLLGVEAYFKKVNDQGGVNGKKLRLIALDDGYEPSRAAPNMRKLIEDDNVVAVIGNVGTPTAVVSVPIANEKNTLLFGAFTGAGVLRKSPPDRYVINYRASYAEETAAMIEGLLANGIKPREIAFFTQNDAYGDAGYDGAMQALKSRGVADTEKLVHGRYTRNTLNVENGLAAILDAEVEPKAIIMVGAYAPCAKFIKMAREDFPDAIFLNVSFVGSTALSKALGDEGGVVIITQVVPHFNSNLKAIREYQQDIKTYSAKALPSFVSLEGYIAAKIFVEGLRKAGKDITREAIVDGIESIKGMDIGIGTAVSYSKTIHQASHEVWPTRIMKNEIIPFDWKSLNQPK